MSGGNVAASVRARLRNIALAEGIDFAAVLTRYGLERIPWGSSVPRIHGWDRRRSGETLPGTDGCHVGFPLH